MSVCVIELLLFNGLFSEREKQDFYLVFFAFWSLFYFLRGRFFFWGGTLLLPPQVRGILYFFTSSFVRARFPVFLVPFASLAAVFNAFA